MSSFARNTEYYRESFRAFKTEQLKEEIPFLQEKVIPAFLKTLTRTNKNSSDAINILSVGAGDGDPDLYLIYELLDKFVLPKDGKITYTVIEFNPGFVASFQEKVKQNSHSLKKVEFHWICDFFENVAGNSEFVAKFDIIVFYHVLYQMDVYKVLEKSVDDLMKPGGCVFGAVQGETNFLGKLFDRYRPRISGLWDGIYLFSGQDLEQFAMKKQWRYESILSYGSMDIKAAFEPQTRKGRLILDFFFQTRDVIELLGQETLAEVFEMLRGLRLKDSTIDEAECRVPKDTGMIVIYGP